MNEKEINKCPKCGGALENGVMQASSIVFWTKDGMEEHWTSTSILFEGRKTTLESPTWRCKNCQIAIFSYDKKNLKE